MKVLYDRATRRDPRTGKLSTLDTVLSERLMTVDARLIWLSTRMTDHALLVADMRPEHPRSYCKDAKPKIPRIKLRNYFLKNYFNPM